MLELLGKVVCGFDIVIGTVDPDGGVLLEPPQMLPGLINIECDRICSRAMAES